jgi:arylesterase / paraoxonase
MLIIEGLCLTAILLSSYAAKSVDKEDNIRGSWHMRRVVKYTLVGLAAVVVVVGGWALFVLNHYNHFNVIASDDSFNCVPMPGTQGGEDIAVDWKNRQAFISSGGLVGDIRRYDLDREGEAVKVLPANLPAPAVFRGHGISLYAPERGQRKLFVVNHGVGREQITIFKVSPEGELSLEENIRNAHLYDPNDIQAVGPRQFYVVNSSRLGGSRYKNPFGALRFLGGNATGSVVYFDGQKFQTVAEPITHGNGINQSPDGTHIYVAQTTANNVAEYRRNIQTGALKFQRFYDLPGSPDNISVSPKGELFVAAFPQFITFVLEAVSRRIDPRTGAFQKPVPSQVVKITPGSAMPVKQFWIDDGARVAGATVGVPFAGAGGSYRFFVSGFGRSLICSPKAPELVPN